MDIQSIIASIVISSCLTLDTGILSMTIGLRENPVNAKRKIIIAIIFSFFQAIMPLIGFFIGKQIYFLIETIFPYLSFLILLFMGITLLIDFKKSTKDKDFYTEHKKTPVLNLIFQALATSFDALTIGFSYAGKGLLPIIIVIIAIAIFTFLMSIIGIIIGEKCGLKYEKQSKIHGGIILIIISFELLIKKFFKI